VYSHRRPTVIHLVLVCAAFASLAFSCEAERDSGSSSPGHPVGHTRLTYTDDTRSARSVPVEVYYPATVAGDNTPWASGLFPLVVVAHGFQIGVDSYDYLWEYLVPRGYVAALVDTETVLFPSHSDFAQDLAFVVEKMQAGAGSPDSPFYQHLASTSAVVGHSMGGGATVLSVQYSAHITTIVPLAAAETNPSAIEAAALVNIPALLFSGSKDCVTPADTNQGPMFNAMPSTCKFHLTITDGSHCQFAQDASLCNLGQSLACPFRQYVDDAVQKALTLEFTGLWLDATLKRDMEARAAFDQRVLDENGKGSIAYQGSCVGGEGEGEGELVVLAPNGGEAWTVGNTQAVDWDGPSALVGPDVRIGLHRGVEAEVFVQWLIRRTANDGSYLCLLPADIEPGTDYRIRVQSFLHSDVRDFSDGPFSIAPAVLIVTDPTGGEQWRPGESHGIRWSSLPGIVGSEVRIGLHKGATFLFWIHRKTANDGEFEWRIPSDLLPHHAYRIRVQSYADASVRCMSRAFSLLSHE